MAGYGLRGIDPAGGPAPVGNYSQALEVPAGSKLVFISGQIPERPDGSVPEGFDPQCNAVWDNVLASLSAAGMGQEHLVKVTTFLTSRDQAGPNSRIRQARLGAAWPADKSPSSHPATP